MMADDGVASLTPDPIKLKRLFEKQPDLTVRDFAAYDAFTKVVESVVKATEVLDAATMSADNPFLVPNLLCLPRQDPATMTHGIRGRHTAVEFDLRAADVIEELAYPGSASGDEPTLLTYNLARVCERFWELGGSYHKIDADVIFSTPLPDRFVNLTNPLAVESMIKTGMAAPFPESDAGFRLTDKQFLQTYRFPKINVGKNDYVLPVCHEGENRSQTVQAIVFHVLGAGSVSDSHGVRSGNDPVPYEHLRRRTCSYTFEDTQEARITSYAPVVGLNDYIDETTYQLIPDSATGRLISADLENNPFLKLTGMFRRPKCGFAETILGMGDTAIDTPLWPKRRDGTYDARRTTAVWQDDDERETERMFRSMKLARQWFTNHYYRPSMLRARAPHGRVVFVAFAEAGAIVVSRLVEAAQKFGERLDDIYVVHVNMSDVIAHTRTAAERTLAIANITSLFRFTSTKCCAFCGTDYALRERPITQGIASSSKLFTCGPAVDYGLRPPVDVGGDGSAYRGRRDDEMTRPCRYCGNTRVCPTCTFINPINLIGKCTVCETPLPLPYIEAFADPGVAFGGRGHKRGHRVKRARRTPRPSSRRKSRSGAKPRSARRAASARSRRAAAKKPASRRRGRTPR